MSHYDEQRELEEKYAVGTELECIKAVNTKYYTVDKIYTVVSKDGCYVYLNDDEGNTRHQWSIGCLESDSYDTRFKVVTKQKPDLVNSPNHYMFFDTEAIKVIRNSMTAEEFKGYCKGNALKYRLRAGKKDATEQEIAKAEKYESLYEEYKDGD